MLVVAACTSAALSICFHKTFYWNSIPGGRSGEVATAGPGSTRQEEGDSAGELMREIWYETCYTPWFCGGPDFIYYCPSHDTNPCLWVHFSSSVQKLSPATGGGGRGGLRQLQHSALLRPGAHVRRLRHSIRRWVVRTSWYLFNLDEDERWGTTPSKSYLQQPASH